MGGKYKWITQPDLLPFAVVSLLVFAPLFNTPQNHVSTHFAAVLLYSTHLVSIGPACLWPYTNGAFHSLSLLSICSWCVVSALAPLSCGSRRIIQVDAAHWWWLRRDPPHMIVKRFGCTTIHKKRYIKCIIHSLYSEVGNDKFLVRTVNWNALPN